jgi:GNAT superfamily N-acetyltransferase
VGRGGVELELALTSTVEESAAELLGETWPLPPAWPGQWTSASEAGHTDRPVVVSARAPDEPEALVGVAIGRVAPAGATLDRLVVEPSRRREGVARRLVAEFCRAAAAHGPSVVSVQTSVGAAVPGPDPSTVAAALGFTHLGAQTWCRRVGPDGPLASPA